MKYNKWIEKLAVTAEKMISKKCKYCNTEKGCYIASLPGDYAFFYPGYSVLSVDPKQSCPGLQKVIEENTRECVLSDTITCGKTDENKKCKKIENREKNICVYIYDSILNKFPKNALYYVSGKSKPVLVGLWENDQLYILGVALPFRVEVAGFNKI